MNSYGDYSSSESRVSQSGESPLPVKSKPHKQQEKITEHAKKHIVEREGGVKEKSVKIKRSEAVTVAIEGRVKEICDQINDINGSLLPFKLKLRGESEIFLSREMEVHHLLNFLPSRPQAEIQENYKKIEKEIEGKLKTFDKLVKEFKKVRKDLITPERWQQFQQVTQNCCKVFLPVLTSLDLIRNDDFHKLILEKAENIKSNEESSGTYINAHKEKINLTKIEQIIKEIKTNNIKISEELENTFSLVDEGLISQIIQEELHPEKLIKTLKKEFNNNKEIYSKLKTKDNSEVYIKLRYDTITMKADLKEIKQLKFKVNKMKEGSSIQAIKNQKLFKKLGVSDDATLDQLKNRLNKAESSLENELTNSNTILSNFFEKNLEARDDELIYNKLNKQESVAFERELKIVELRNELPVLVVNDYIEQKQRLPLTQDISAKLFQLNMLNISKSSTMNPSLFVYTAPSEVPLRALENILKRAA